ncbi:MAG TPA: cysteine--tRNA ligase [Lachnospiraceae bacterium]|nr:cysteine--tRNA ligase [Lachnospiraceae bacterium]HAP73326.1 cysteine--tRNA ligase [Lachnospiraceae bacterium]HBH71153.1 cysteine--tRNA ligase [Lachnospiraceae bacterium]
MRIYNTETKTLEEFKPITPGKVSMYVCGPTVYNLIHIGNARPMIVFDTVRRYFEYKGYEVNYVSNFTDVDDKIIKKANEEGVDASVISERYIKECKKDMADLNVRPATTHPQATKEIQGMIDMISTLIDKGYAYVVDDGTVYFAVDKDPNYGELSHKNLDDLQSGFRSIAVSGEDQKRSPLDFVLWKPKKEGEPYWDSPWCQGRPGWHIECSVMSRKYLGETIDIHAGGEDLIFPHHENEIAQSECANGKPFVHYWMHNAFLNIDNHKMSKSLGNFKTVRDVDAVYDPQVLRFLMLSAHYRSPLNYSVELMDAAKTSYERLVNCCRNLDYNIENAADKEISEEEKKLLEQAHQYRLQFEKVMDDDFNTADAISALFDLMRFINTNSGTENSKTYLASLRKEFTELSDVLGLIVDRKPEASDDETAYIEEKIKERQEARKARDFKKADAIRDELKAKGILLEDTKEGVKWTKA